MEVFDIADPVRWSVGTTKVRGLVGHCSRSGDGVDAHYATVDAFKDADTIFVLRDKAFVIARQAKSKCLRLNVLCAGPGTGKEMMHAVFAWARKAGLTKIKLVSLPHARGFYTRLGFEPIGVETVNLQPMVKYLRNDNNWRSVPDLVTKASAPDVLAISSLRWMDGWTRPETNEFIEWMSSRALRDAAFLSAFERTSETLKVMDVAMRKKTKGELRVGKVSAHVDSAGIVADVHIPKHPTWLWGTVQAAKGDGDDAEYFKRVKIRGGSVMLFVSREDVRVKFDDPPPRANVAVLVNRVATLAGMLAAFSEFRGRWWKPLSRTAPRASGIDGPRGRRIGHAMVVAAERIAKKRRVST